MNSDKLAKRIADAEGMADLGGLEATRLLFGIVKTLAAEVEALSASTGDPAALAKIVGVGVRADAAGVEAAAARKAVESFEAKLQAAMLPIASIQGEVSGLQVEAARLRGEVVETNTKVSAVHNEAKARLETLEAHKK